MRVLSLAEEKFMRESFKEGLRLDGRSLLDPRPLQIRFGHENGQVYLTAGETRLQTKASLKITNPRLGKP